MTTFILMFIAYLAGSLSVLIIVVPRIHKMHFKDKSNIFHNLRHLYSKYPDNFKDYPQSLIALSTVHDYQWKPRDCLIKSLITHDLEPDKYNYCFVDLARVTLTDDKQPHVTQHYNLASPNGLIRNYLVTLLYERYVAKQFGDLTNE